MARFAVVAAIVTLLAVTAAVQAPGAALIPALKMALLPAPPTRSLATAPMPVATSPTATSPSPMVPPPTPPTDAPDANAPSTLAPSVEADKKRDGVARFEFSKFPVARSRYAK
ncbi:Os03g0624900 [Oryza sativa Japonica Group]|uniref:Os03g0624900 protein n=1 Tax=Oryza sativa subsp. japonica TaxID=39947 RepID=Q0DQ81_ORYSJ|nr:Os03g0624900 [Oryza sativa Japonica Group]|eukprot:NP_001050693.2 Os03g0624900 [Oryza sativa Japonica Group]